MRLSGKTPARLAAATLAILLAAQSGAAFASPKQPGDRNNQGTQVEHQREPSGYHRIERPAGAEVRPQQFDRSAYAHEFQASRTFSIGPYHAEPGWRHTRWQLGQFLPAALWAECFRLTDYWLFGLDVPPLG